MKTIVFFNNKGGVGKTTLVYHFTYMLAEMGYKSLAIDLDYQPNLTSMFLSDERLEEIYDKEGNRPTIWEGINPVNKGINDVVPVHIEEISDKIGLIAGDVELSLFEDKLISSWGNCLKGDEVAFRIVSSFYRIIEEANRRFGADINIIDIGPNSGAI
ncbi:MAG: AAA family ATPase, partial [Flavobacteriales bacterium]|nr:AAA family ATPase [Flavobacteriales bacterium]